jgi:hemoglobin
MNHFDKYGGVSSMTLVINDFYKRVLQHPKLMNYFSHISQDALINHQIKFASFLLGKPSQVLDHELMKSAHQGRGISESAFVELASIFAEVLFNHGFSAIDAEQIVKRCDAFRSVIVEKPAFIRKVH